MPREVPWETDRVVWVRELRLAVSAVTPTCDKQGLFALSTTSDLSPTIIRLAVPDKSGRSLSMCRSKLCTVLPSPARTSPWLAWACFTHLNYDSEHSIPLPTKMKSPLLLLRATRIISPPCTRDQSDHILRVHRSGFLESVVALPTSRV